MSRKKKEQYETPKLESIGPIGDVTLSGAAPNSDAGPFTTDPNDAWGQIS